MHSGTSTSKPHYPILDGLRGVASLVVVAFHICEAHATSHLDQLINHGYLAVDFFFLLSGFVIGYAYDDRWDKMSFADFCKRRFLRLQPMVIMGMIIGAATFYLQASHIWPRVASTPVWKLLLAMVIGCLMIPLPPSKNIRGFYESYPLNGPAWSLFFEYIVNILYALFIRRFSKKALAVLVTLSGVALVHFLATGSTGDVVGGWTLEAAHLRIGFTRVMYPFFAGLLLFRLAKLRKIENAFFWCSAMVIITLAMPRIGAEHNVGTNGLYEAFSIIFIFPLIVYLGASGELRSNASRKACKLLGDISYPIYITHYPLIYIYTAWVYNNKVTITKGAPIAALVFISAILLAYACLRLYDEPVRLWLKRKFLSKSVYQPDNIAKTRDVKST